MFIHKRQRIYANTSNVLYQSQLVDGGCIRHGEDYVRRHMT